MSLAEQVKQYKDGEILKVVDVLLPIFRSNSSVYYRKRLISEDLRKRLGEKLSALQNILTDLELPDVHPLVLDKILIILNKAFRSQNAHSSERVDEDPYELLIDAILLLSQQKEIDSKEDNRYGYYDSVREEIIIFNKVRVDGEPVDLIDTQIQATFLHELIHCFQWHIKGCTDEWEAQSYSGLMVEFLQTRQDNEEFV